MYVKVLDDFAKMRMHVEHRLLPPFQKMLKQCLAL